MSGNAIVTLCPQCFYGIKRTIMKRVLAVLAAAVAAVSCSSGVANLARLRRKSLGVSMRSGKPLPEDHRSRIGKKAPMMRRIAALATALILAAPAAAGASGTSTAMFGGNLSVAQYEAQQGHPVAIARYYAFVGNTTFAGGQAWAAIMSQGTTVLASIDLDISQHGQTYPAVAAGAYDKQILSWLQGAEAAAVKYGLPQLWVTFEHEVNDPAQHPARLGTAAQYVAAYDHVRALAAANSLNWQQGGRLHWTWILAHRGFYPPIGGCAGCGTAASFFPGASQVDAIGVDGYNRLGCTDGHHGYATGSSYDTPATLFDPAVAFAQANNLPLMIAEFGSDAYQDPSVQAGFITAVKDYVIANSRITVAMYWNGPGGTTTCLYDIFGYPQSAAALAAMQQALTGRP